MEPIYQHRSRHSFANRLEHAATFSIRSLESIRLSIREKTRLISRKGTFVKNILSKNKYSRELKVFLSPQRRIEKFVSVESERRRKREREEYERLIAVAISSSLAIGARSRATAITYDTTHFPQAETFTWCTAFSGDVVARRRDLDRLGYARNRDPETQFAAT